MYSILRLIIIALMITYFIGCIFYFISNDIANGVDMFENDTSEEMLENQQNRRRLLFEDNLEGMSFIRYL